MDSALKQGHMWSSHPHSPELNASEATADLINKKAGDLKRCEEETTRSPLQEGGEGKDDADVIPAATDKNPFRSSQRSTA